MDLANEVSDRARWVERSLQEMSDSTRRLPTEGQADPIVPVILSGGEGSRLWPFSTSETPKQFLPLFSEGESLFEQTLGRVNDRARFKPPIVVTSERHAAICEQGLANEGDQARLILEPCGRNTAPAIVMAAVAAAEIHGDSALLLVMPSDHIIERLDEFHHAVARALPAARSGKMVTFGINPTAPETGYGYVEMGAEVAGCAGVRDVARFLEKPSHEVAVELVASGDHLWNAGIFLFRTSTILEQAENLAPVIASAARAAISGAKREGLRILPDPEIFAGCPSESVDYAIMEHSLAIAVVPMSAGWSDLGSWDAFAALTGYELPAGPVTAVDCESCYFLSDGIEVAALGVRDLIIVASGGRLLILPRGRSQEVKRLLSAMDSMAA